MIKSILWLNRKFWICIGYDKRYIESIDFTFECLLAFRNSIFTLSIFLLILFICTLNFSYLFVILFLTILVFLTQNEIIKQVKLFLIIEAKKYSNDILNEISEKIKEKKKDD